MKADNMLEDIETTFHIEHVAYCDACNNVRRSDEWPETFAKNLEKEGWELIRSVWYCADCANIF